VATVRFSRRAERDLLSIGECTLATWGKIQTARYLDDLEKLCATLAENPKLGRPCDEVRPGLRRHEHGKHVIFYRRQLNSILIIRILHQSMLPEKHGMGDPSA